MSSLGNVLRSAPRHVALGAVIGAAMAFIPAAADQHASAVASVTATVHAPVVVHSVSGGNWAPAPVTAATPHAYSVRQVGDSSGAVRTIFVDFE